MTDDELMDLAMQMAEQNTPAEITVPRVGCVIASPAGEPLMFSMRGAGDHAEKIALEAAANKGADLTNTTVYTTLEPCTFHARREPGDSCAERLIRAHVRRVVVGSLDPNQDVCGRGILMLQNAGIEVSLFPYARTLSIQRANREFIRAHQTLGIRITQPATTYVEVSSGKEYAVEGTLLNVPDEGDLCIFVGNKQGRWWPQQTPISINREAKTWSTKVDMTHPGDYRVAIVRLSTLGKTLVAYYMEVSRKRREFRDWLVEELKTLGVEPATKQILDRMGPPFMGINMPTLPKGCDAQGWLTFDARHE